MKDETVELPVNFSKRRTGGCAPIIEVCHHAYPGKSLLQGDGKHVPANLSNPGSWSSADSILAMDQMFTSGRAVGVSPSSLRVFCWLIES